MQALCLPPAASPFPVRLTGDPAWGRAKNSRNGSGLRSDLLTPAHFLVSLSLRFHICSMGIRVGPSEQAGEVGRCGSAVHKARVSLLSSSAAALCF